MGGTILDHLIKDTSQSLKEVAIDVLVRKEDQAEKLREVYGGRIGTILWKGLMTRISLSIQQRIAILL